MLKEFPREVLGIFVLRIIVEDDQISVKKNFRKQFFGGIKGMTFNVFIIHGNNTFQKRMTQVTQLLGLHYHYKNMHLLDDSSPLK